ncbi:MAG TPA: hypothetical protein VFZ48_05660 [Candidatus Saccharimonadales bacterium]
MKKAFVVVFEGNNGSGKGTQFELAKDRAVSEGMSIASFDFPQYGKPSAKPIEEYLRGEKHYTPLEAAKMYANDRLSVQPEMAEAAQTNDMLFMNRYVSSNLAYQGAMVDDPDERATLIKKIETLEYTTNKLPKPDLVIILSVEPRVAQLHVDKKAKRSYTDGRDIHEADLNLETRVAHIYHELCATRDNFEEIYCMQDEDTMRSREDIHREIWELIKRRMTK